MRRQLDVPNCLKIFQTFSNIEFFVFPKPEERTLKIIIRSLTTDISEEELSDKFKSKGYEVSFVRQLMKSDRKLSRHIVTLLSNSNSKDIFYLHPLFYISTKIEPYRSNNPSQYYNYHCFRHSSLYCSFSSRFLKCAGSHPTKDFFSKTKKY